MQEKNKYIVILGAGDAQLPFILTCRELGFKTIVFDIDKDKIGAKKSDLFYEISIYKSNEIIKILHKLKLDIDAVIARVTNKNGLQTGHKIAKKFNTIFASKLLLELGTDKSILSKFCNDNNILIPHTTLIKTKNDLNNFIINNNKSYIIKPSLTTIGKKNIIKFNKSDNLLNLFSLASSISDNGEVLIQEYIDGIDISVLVEFKNNKFNIIASWDEIIGIKEDNHIQGLGLCSPSIINSEDKLLAQINIIVEEFNRLLVNEKYLAVFSFRIKNLSEAYLIEIHTDLTGDLIAEKLLPATNKKFNFFRLVLNFLLEKKDIETYKFKDTILLYGAPTLLGKQSTIQKIELLEKVINKNKIIELSYFNYLKGKLNEE